MPRPKTTQRGRVIFELPLEVQMAIKLRAAKTNAAMGTVVSEAIQKVFVAEIREAKAALAELNPKRSA